MTDQQLPVIFGYQHFAVARPCKVGGQVRKHSGGILIYVSEFNVHTYEEAYSVDCTSLCNDLQIPELEDTRPPPQLWDVVAPSGWYKELLGLCGATGYRILNGRIAGDLIGEYTCFANHDHNTVDYMIVSPEMFEVA